VLIDGEAVTEQRNEEMRQVYRFPPNFRCSQSRIENSQTSDGLSEVVLMDLSSVRVLRLKRKGQTDRNKKRTYEEL